MSEEKKVKAKAAPKKKKVESKPVKEKKTKVVKSENQAQKMAVVETGGKQYIVTEGASIDIEKIEGEPESNVTFDKVLLVAEGDNVKVGQPYLEKAKISATLVKHDKGEKLMVFKFKRKTGYKKKNGHRQRYTRVKIGEIHGA